MDTKISMENLCNAVKVIRNNQKAHAAKIVELGQKVDAIDKMEFRLKQLEKALETEMKETDKRFDSAIDRFDSSSSVIDDHIVSIGDLEEEKDDIKKKLDQIDDTMNKLDDEVKTIKNNIKIIVEVNKSKEKETTFEIKTCKYNNFGYCKVGNENCSFYHSNEVCEIYEMNRVCFRMKCTKRHPRPCRYYNKQQCHRGNQCKYLHKDKEQNPGLTKDDIGIVDSVVTDKSTSDYSHSEAVDKNYIPDSCSGCKNEETIFKCKECSKRFGRKCLIESHTVLNMYMKKKVNYRCDTVHKNPCM